MQQVDTFDISGLRSVVSRVAFGVARTLPGVVGYVPCAHHIRVFALGGFVLATGPFDACLWLLSGIQASSGNEF